MSRPMNKLADELIELCWTRINPRSNRKDYITTYQVFDLIQQLQELLSRKTIFDSNELQLLKEMSQSNPSMKLYKYDLADFLSKLAHYSNLERLLSERVGVTQYELQRVIDNENSHDKYADNIQFRKPLSPYNRRTYNKQMPHKSASLYTSTPIMNQPTSRFESHIERPSIISPPLSPIAPRSRSRVRLSTNDDGLYNKREMNELRTSIMAKEQQIVDRDNQISIISNENNSLNSINKIQRLKITELENNVNNLQKYTDALEKQLENKSNYTRPIKSEIIRDKELIDKITAQDNIIENLEVLCNRYQEDLISLAQQEKGNNLVIDELKTSLKKQNILIENIRLKFNLLNSPETSNEITVFLKKLPFIKQYHMFYKYQQEQKNFGLLFINVLTLIFTTIILLNVIKFIFYLMISFKDGGFHEQNTLEYIYDDDSLSWISDYSDTKISVVWWKQIQWLDYLVYTIGDWINS